MGAVAVYVEEKALEAEKGSMPARVSSFTRWNNSVVESRKNLTDYFPLDQFRLEVVGQEDLYDASVRPFVNRCLQGCSGSIITYGAWGSGKSYTLGSLDPQQLAPGASENDTAGVLFRCTRHLYEWLGQDAAVEVTCVEVQGDEVVDLLDSRVAPLSFGRLTGVAESSGGGLSSTSSSGAVGAGSPGPPGHTGSPATGFSRSPIAAAAVSAYRRRPLSLVLARSLTEALATLERAVTNRQAFVTATRHSSSRTHAVFQLRWRNPAAPAAIRGCGTAAATARAAAPSAGECSGGGAVPRAISAPPRSSIVMAPGGCLAAAGVAERPYGAGGPVCTLTLVDTCSFCPLLPPKEGNAVKRSLLALSRVLSALQRRHALSLRESKLTRMLEGALDQVLLLACLGGVAGDEATVQLVKALQLGPPREITVRRSRRVSTSDSIHTSGAWESSTSLCAGGVISVGASGGRRTQAGPCAGTTVGGARARAHSAAAVAAGIQEKYALSGRAGAPVSPMSPGYGAMPSSRLVVAGRTVSPRKSSSFSYLHGVSEAPYSDRTAHDSMAVRDGGVYRGRSSTCGLSLAAAAAATPKTASPLPRSLVGAAVEAPRLHSPEGAAGSSRTPQPIRRRRAVSTIAGSSGAATAPPAAAGLATRRLNSHGISAWLKPASVTARASPSFETRRSQGFSVLLGKWAPPPPITPRDSSFPILPCVIASPGDARPSPRQCRVRAMSAGVSNDSNMSSLAAQQPKPRRSGVEASVSVHAAVNGQELTGSAMAGVAVQRGACVSTASSRCGDGMCLVSPFAPASRKTDGPAVDRAAVCALTAPGRARLSSLGAAATVDATEASTTTCVSPSATTPTSARRRSGIPARPLSRSPLQTCSLSPFAGAAAVAATAAAAVPSPSTSHVPPRCVARSPSPAGGATLISLAGVPPTRFASMRYGSANMSHDSNSSASAAAISALLSEYPEDAPPASQERRSLLRKRAAAVAVPGGGADGGEAEAECRSREDSAALACKRSISSGTRWPSPLLRARRAEWLADARRSKSALPRSVAETPQPLAGSALSPRQAPHGFRCAPMARPNLSAQYKDLLQDFQAFKALKRTPRHRRSNAGSAVAPSPGAPDTPPEPVPASAAAAPPRGAAAANGCLCGRLPAEATTSPAASGALTPDQTGLAHGGAAATVSLAQTHSGALGAFATVAIAAAGSPAASTGLNPGSPAVSTPQSGRPASGSCSKPPPAFSRAHSSSADEMLLCLTAAAAAAAAASPRAAASGGAPPSSRPRPGVSRAAGATASPRPLRSPERPGTPVSPATVLDMSRLFAGKGSPSAGAAAGSGPSRLSAGSLTTGAAGGQLVSGGSDRYRRLAGEDADSVRTSDAETDLDLNGDRGGGSASDLGIGSESDCDNLLGPSCLGNLGLMLDIGGDVGALRASINQMALSGRASPAGASARPAAGLPSPLRRTVFAAAAAAAAVGPCSSRTAAADSEGTDEELPAVSFFIHQFSPRASARRGRLGSAREPPQAEAAGAVAAASPGGGTAPSGRPLTSPVIRRGTDAVSGGRQEIAPPKQRRNSKRGLQNESEEHLPRRMRRPSGQASGAAGATGLPTSYVPADRTSVESGVLRGSCTPFAVDGNDAHPHRISLSRPTQASRPQPEEDMARQKRGRHEGQAEEERARKAVASPPPVVHDAGAGPDAPSHSSISLRQLLEQQQQLLQQRQGRRAAGPATATTDPVKCGSLEPPDGQGQGQAPGWPPSPPRAANRLLAQRAHVRPNHVDLDEHSNVLMEADSASEPDVSALASPDSLRPSGLAAAQRSSRSGVGGAVGGRAAAIPVHHGARVASPSRPRIPVPEPSAAMQARSPAKPSPARSTPPAAPSPPQQQQPQHRAASSAVDGHSSILDRINAREAAQTAAANAAAAAWETTPRLIRSPTSEGIAGRGDNSGAQPSWPTAAAPAPAQGASSDGARGGAAQTRFAAPTAAPAATVHAAATPAGAVAAMLTKQATAAGSATVQQPPQPQPAVCGPGHRRLFSADSDLSCASGPGISSQGSLGHYPMPPLPPQAPPALPSVAARSVDEDSSTGCPPAVSIASPLLPLSAAQQQQHLRGSGNVAAAWRAAAAVSTSSSSSVRSCFRSSTGQQQQQQHQQPPPPLQQQNQQLSPLQQQHITMGSMTSDATAVATVVALNRTAPAYAGAGVDDKHGLALHASGHIGSNESAKLGSDSERLQQIPLTTTSHASTTAAAAATAAAPSNSATVPPPPPHSQPDPTPFAVHAQHPAPCVPPLVLPQHGGGGAVPVVGVPAEPNSVLTKAKSARSDRLLPLTARLRGFKSHRTPRPPVDDGGHAAALNDSVEPQPTPPPAYPPGFVSWATKLFSGGRKGKLAG